MWQGARSAAFWRLLALLGSSHTMLHLVSSAVCYFVTLANLSHLDSHLVVRSLYLCCAVCGHGAHPDCLANFAAILAPPSARHSHDASPYDASHPSTPGIGTPLRAWMWGEDGEDEEEETVEIAEADEKIKERVELLNSCPAGLCGHSPCILTLALEQM